MKHEPAKTPESSGVDSRRTWELLGHATRVEPSENFADRVLAAAALTPQDRPPSKVLRWLQWGAPFAAAAALLLSFSSQLFLSPVSPSSEVANVADSASTGDLDRLARLDAALTSLPNSAESSDYDARLIEVASLDDPTELTDEQLFALLY